MSSRRIYILLFFFLGATFANVRIIAQTVLRLQQAPSENRISENASRCVIKDRQGFIWVATIDGLNRYDGYRFRIYQTDSRDSNSISGNYISQLFEDSKGRLWVGTGSGLNLYDPLTDGFQHFKETRNGIHAELDDHITDLQEDHRHRLWVSTYDGLGTYELDDFRFTKFTIDTTARPDALVFHRVTALLQAGDSSMWVGYSNGRLSRFRNGKFTHYLKDPLPSEIVEILEGPEGRIWLGTGDGVYRFDPATEQAEKLIDGRCWDLYYIDDNIWANIHFAGVYQWNPGKNTFENVTIYYDNEVARGDVKAFFKDDNGIIWATFHGLYKRDPYEERFQVVRHEKGNINSLNDPFVSAISEDEKGNLVVMTVNQGVNYYDRQKKQWLHHGNDRRFDNALKGIQLSSLTVFGHTAYVDVEDAIYEFDLYTSQLRKFTQPTGGRGGNNSMIRKSDHELWLSGPGIYLLNTQTGKFHIYTPKLEGDNISYKLCEDSQGQIWAITQSRIFKYVAPADKFVECYSFGESKFTYEEGVISFVRDRNGRFWIGRRNGMEFFDPADHTFKHYSIADGLPSNVVNSILITEKGDLWLGTNNGLSHFEPREEKFTNYDRNDGVQDEIFLPGSNHLGKDGIIYLGGVNGFNYFHPDSLVGKNPYPPKVLITDLKIFNKSVKPGPRSVLSRPMSETDEIVLSYKDASISFELLALGYSQSQKNQYAYKMEKVDPDWNYVGTGQTASYSGLPRGEWLRFAVKAANHDGTWVKEPKVVRIYVHPPFWETNWFRISLLLFLLGTIFFYYRWRIRSIKLRNQWLEREVKKQTAEIQTQAGNLRTANLELRQQAEIIQEQVRRLDQLNKAQTRFFTSLSHEFRTPLTLLLGNMEALIYSKDPQKEVGTLTRRMQMSAQQLLALINQLMDTAKLESGQYRLNVQAGNIQEEIYNICATFQALAEAKGLKLELQQQGASEAVWYDNDIILKVLNNLLSNAIKFTERGGISVKTLVADDGNGLARLQLEVKDSGIGIPAGQLPFIFDRFFQAEGNPAARKKGTGVGLSLVKLLVELHKGQIEVSSEENEGTCFRIKLPVDESVFRESEKSNYADQPFAFKALNGAASLAVEGEPQQGGPAAQDAPLLLIVEDNPEIRSFIIRQLRSQYLIEEAEDGEQALEMAIQKVPDLIISDVMMPRMNGFEFCQRIKGDARTSHIPVILLTALAGQSEKLTGLQKGADAYLSKPFSREELLLRISNLIAFREKIRQQFLKEYSLDHLPAGLSELDQAFITKLNDLIEANLTDESFGLNKLIKASGVSRTQLFRKLKSITGMSASEFIRDYRLRKAYQLLNQEELTVSEVIYATGFNSRSYFYDSFKKKFGVAPTQLKKV